MYALATFAEVCRYSYNHQWSHAACFDRGCVEVECAAQRLLIARYNVLQAYEHARRHVAFVYSHTAQAGECKS
jgi:hypothetical protein